MKKALWLPVLFMLLLAGRCAVAQNLSVSAAEEDDKFRYVVIGTTDKGYYAMRIAESKVNTKRYRDFNLYAIDEFDNNNKRVNTYDNWDLASSLGNKDIKVLEAVVFNNELTFICSNTGEGDRFLIIQPFAKKTVGVHGLNVMGRSFDPVDVCVSGDGKQLFIYETPERVTHDNGNIPFVVFNDKLERMQTTVVLKEPATEKKKLETTCRYYGKTLVMQHEVYNDKYGAHSMMLDVVDFETGTAKHLDLAFSNFESVGISSTYDAKTNQLYYTCLYRDRKETASEAPFSGYICRAVDLGKGELVKDTKHEYTAAEKKMLSEVEYGMGTLSEFYSSHLDNGDMVILYRLGRGSDNPDMPYDTHWFDLYAISHTDEGALKWAKNTEYKVKSSDRFDESIIVAARPAAVALMVDAEDSPTLHMIDADGTMTTKSLADFGAIDKNSSILTEEAYVVAPGELLVPCVYKESLEMLRIKF